MSEWRAALGPGSLQGRLLWGTVLVTAVVMTAVLLVVEHRQRIAIIDEVQRRGGVLGRDLAAISAHPLLLYNFTALEQNVERVAAEDDVVYAIILDAKGKVAAHNRAPERIGLVLPSALDERAASTTVPLVQEATERQEALYDIAVPIHVNGEKWGTVRVGVSKRRMEAQLRKTRAELGALTGITLLLSGLGAALIARRIARPVRKLADGVSAIARG